MKATERDASLGMPFRVSRQVAISWKRRPVIRASHSQSQTKSHGFTYYDLHIMIYILVHCLSSTLSLLLASFTLLCQPYVRNRRRRRRRRRLSRAPLLSPLHNLVRDSILVLMEKNFTPIISEKYIRTIGNFC